jgi:hypothetical protein
MAAGWLAGFMAVLIAAATVYYQMFDGFSDWDDDGYVALGIRSLLAGRRLYDEIYSQYGPFYYLSYGAIYAVSGQPVSHDAQRFIGAALWLAAAMLWAYTVYLLTRSPLWTCFGLFLGVRLLYFFPRSAGHPEEICMALVAAVAVAACGLRRAAATGNVVALGCLVAAIALTKVNLGLFVAIAAGLVFLKAGPPARWRRFAEFSLGLFGFVLPVALMSPLFMFSWARNYALVAMASIGAALLIAHAMGPLSEIPVPIWRWAALSFTACAALIILPFYIHGTTLTALFQMTVLQHVGAARNWYHSLHISWINLLAVATSLAAAGIAYRRMPGILSGDLAAGIHAPVFPGKAGPSVMARMRSLTASIRVDDCLLALKALAGLTCIFQLAGGRLADVLFKYCVPFAWLVLVPTRHAAVEETRVGRTALCFLAVFVFLYAYPVAGAQVFFANVPAGVLAVVLLRDATLGIADSAPGAFFPPRLVRAGRLAGAALIAALFSVQLLGAYRSYEKDVSLEMPGAARLRVTPQQRAIYHFITDKVASCEALYSVPGLFSLYFWTARDSPTNLTAGNAIGLLTASQQSVIVNDLSRYTGMCIVYSPELVEYWRRGQDLTQSPLARYVRSEFAPVAEFDGYFILKRRNAAR